MSKKENTAPETKKEEYSLNDDRRVKVLSPGMLVAKRFFRNRLAVTGLVILIIMFAFSFIGGIVSPYRQDQLFYRTDVQEKDFAGFKKNTEFRYETTDSNQFTGAVPAKAMLAFNEIGDKNETQFSYRSKTYAVEKITDDFFLTYLDGELIGLGTKEVVSSSESNDKFSFEFTYNALLTEAGKTAKGPSAAPSKIDQQTGKTLPSASPDAQPVEEPQTVPEGQPDAQPTTEPETQPAPVSNKFTADGKTYTMAEDKTIFDEDGKEVAYVSPYIVRAVMNDVFLSRGFKNELTEAVEKAEAEGLERTEFVYTDEDGKTFRYVLQKDASKELWDVNQDKDTTVFDDYATPTKQHWLGTDRNGMDMLTRLMYGGRVSLIIGFIVVFIETILGVILGGIAGYFGGWIDNLIMRIVDIFYCIPSMPIIIILGAAMDSANVESKIRMLYLMLILGILGWAGVARLVRGQILSLREQEFMTATEACGISVPRRIFKHLIPNVIPQLIVYMTMGLGSTIILEATLSFLGLGVRFPFASWGNIINDVNDVYVLTHYWNIWIPAGILLLLTVLAFNIVGDGLRDAFDPKMKR